MIKRLFLASLFLLTALPAQAVWLVWDSTASNPCFEYFEIQSRKVDGTVWITEDKPTVATACRTADGHSLEPGASVAAVHCEWYIYDKNRFYRYRRFFTTVDSKGKITYNPLPWVEAPQLNWTCDGGAAIGSGKVFPIDSTCK